MIRQYYEEWPDDLRLQDYPFVDNASRTDADRTMTLQRQYLLDARLWPRTRSTRVYLRQIERTSQGLNFVISDLDRDLLTASVTLGQLGTQKMPLVDAGVGIGGWLRWSAGALQELYDHPSGIYRFTPQATEFVATAVTPINLGGVTDFQADGLATGDVLFFGGRGVELEKTPEGRIRVNAVGDPYARRDLCLKQDYQGAMLNPLRSIKVTTVVDEVETVVGTLSPQSGTLMITTAESQREVQPEGQAVRPAEGLHAPGPGGEFIVGIV